MKRILAPLFAVVVLVPISLRISRTGIPPPSTATVVSGTNTAIPPATARATATAPAPAGEAEATAIPSPPLLGQNPANAPVALPPGPLQRGLQALPPAGRATALQRLAELQVPRNDADSLRVDARGEFYYVCALPPDLAVAALPDPTTTPPLQIAATTTAAAAVPVASPPLRHSRPGAGNVAYLDFNGHDVAGTSWNSLYGEPLFTCRPYNLDGDATTFSDAEQAAIVRIWARIAEDFAPFDIDVTTEAPANFTTQTAHILITSKRDAAGRTNPEGNVAGGVAFLGVFGRAGYATASPAFIYYDNLINDANVAEAASHEFGHNLGLSHDGTLTLAYYGGHGTGDTSWGPLMGTGYGRNVSQWSQGDYFNANNRQDDLAIIAGRLGYLPDDIGDTNAGALPLNVVDTTVAGAGRIERPQDADRFSFVAGAGPISLHVSPFVSSTGTRGGNLDLKLELYDAGGTLLATDDPAATTAATLMANVVSGTYFLRVIAVGTGTPLSTGPSGYTAYGSEGTYTITGTINPPRDLPPAFVHPPADTTAIVGSTVTLSAEVSGSTPLTYVWRHGPDIVANATTPTLTLANVSSATAGSYTLTVSNPLGQVTSSAATLSVVSAAIAPRITTQPASQVVVAGSAVEFQVAAAGTSPFSYQWLRDGVPLPGATAATLRLSTTSALDAGGYRVTVANTAGTTISVVAALAINLRPQFITQPTALAISPGEAAVFTAAAIGTPIPALRWQQSLDRGATWSNLTDGGDVSGTTTGTVRLANRALTDSGRLFRAVATNAVGEAESDPAVLTVAETPPVVRIATGVYHTLYLKADGTVWSVGFNHEGQLGDGTQDARTRPLQVADHAIAIAAGYAHSLVLKQDGTVWAVGANNYGQLGDGAFDSRVTFKQVASGVADIAAHVYFSAFIGRDGRLRVCGRNTFGEFALGPGAPELVPTPVVIADDVRAVAFGNGHIAIVTHRGALRVSGDNSHGQLGDGSTTSRQTLANVATGVRQVTATYRATLFIKDDDTVWAMGENTWALTGDGTTDEYHVPTQVGSAARRVDGRYTHTLKVLNDGRLLGSGDNRIGQLATGTVSNREGEVPVATGIRVFATGSQNSFWVDGNGATWAVGRNDFGQLGDGATTNRTTPGRIFSGVPTTPPAPTGLDATDGTRPDAVLLTWDPLPGVTAYEVWRHTANDLAHATPLTGDDTLNARPDATAQSGTTYYYWVRAVGPFGPGPFSAPTTGYLVQPDSPPLFVLQPVARTVDVGTTSSFMARASGNPAPALQWQRSTDGGTSWMPLVAGTEITGVTATELQLINVPLATPSWVVRCVATNAIGTATSQTAVLTVNTNARPPVIETPPAPATVRETETVVLSVQASGIGPLTYQWRRNGVTLDQATAATLTLAAVTVAQGGSYDVVVTNAAGSTTSAAAAVTVLGTALVSPATHLSPTTGGGYSIQVNTSGAWAVTDVPSWFVVVPSSGVGPRTLTVAVNANPTGAIRSAQFHVNDAPHTLTQLEDDGLNQWTQENPRLAVNNLNAVVWTGAEYVAVGVDGIVLTSPDGHAWTRGQLPTTTTLYDLAWNGSRLVAVGAVGAIFTSPDGQTWTRQTSPVTSSLSSVCWDGSLFVAAGGTQVLTSSDGISWSAHPTPATQSLNDLAGGNGRYVAVGNGGLLLISSDASTWTSVPTGLNVPLTAVCFNGTTWLATSNATKTFTSPDGVTWTAQTLTTSLIAYDLIWTGQHYVATTGSGVIATSPDGIAWTKHQIEGHSNLNGIALGAQQVVTVGSGGMIASSPDATTWQLEGSIGADPWVDITWGGNRYIAVGSYGDIATSLDGTTWQHVPSPTTRSLASVTWIGSQFVAVGSSGTYLTSPDGLTWTQAKSFTSQSLSRIRRLGGRYVAIGSGTNLYTSLDGVSWSAHSLGRSTSLYDVGWNGTRYVAVGQSGSIFTSPDGTDWTPQVCPTTGHYYALGWNGTRFAAVGANANFISSTDGVTWVEADFGSGFYFAAVQWNGSRFLAVGNGGFTATSLDGVDWVFRKSLPVDNLYGLVAQGNRWTAVGIYGVIISAADLGQTSAPQIALQPQSQTALQHRDAAFSVVAIGSPAPAYQWRRNGTPITGATSPTLTLPRVEAAAVGSYDVLVSNVAGSVTSAAAALQVVSGYGLWQEGQFTLAERNDPARSGPAADPDWDGLTNLLEYALGTTASFATAGEGPQLALDGDHWAFTYTRPSNVDDIAYTVEISFDLQTWTTTGVVTTLQSITGGVQVWRASYPAAAGPHVFFRLRVEQL